MNFWVSSVVNELLGLGSFEMKRKNQEKSVGKNSQPVREKSTLHNSNVTHDHDLHDGRLGCY